MAEALGMGTEWADITRGPQDDLFCGVTLFSVSVVLAQWFSEYSYHVSCNSEAAGSIGQRNGLLKAQLI